MDLLRDWIPDIPRWVEARDLVLSGEYQVFGLDRSDPRGLVLRNPDENVAFVIGRPSPDAVLQAVDSGDVIAGIEARAWLSEILRGWTVETAAVLTAGSPRLKPQTPHVRMVTLSEIEASVEDAELLGEVQAAAEFTEIAASFEDGRRALILAEAAYLSMREHRLVKVSEVQA